MKTMKSFIVLLALTSIATAWITDLKVIEGKSSQAGTNWRKISTGPSSDGDFNQGAAGKFVYLVQTEGSENDAISDLMVVNNGCLQGWNQIQSGDGSDGDFNQGAHGKFVYLCYKKGGSSKLTNIVVVVDLKNCNTMQQISIGNGSDGNFNEGARGWGNIPYIIHLCASWQNSQNNFQL